MFFLFVLHSMIESTCILSDRLSFKKKKNSCTFAFNVIMFSFAMVFSICVHVCMLWASGHSIFDIHKLPPINLVFDGFFKIYNFFVICIGLTVLDKSSTQIPRNLFFCKGGVFRFHIDGHKPYTLYTDNVVNVTLKYILFILQINNI